MKIHDLPPAITASHVYCPTCERAIPRPDRHQRPGDPCAWLSLYCAGCGDVFRGRFFMLQDEPREVTSP